MNKKFLESFFLKRYYMNESVIFQSNLSTQIYLNSNDASIFHNNSMKSHVSFFIQDLSNAINDVIDAKISIANAQIPVSYYNINNTNNIINISINNVITSYTFPIGNYNVYNFITAWNLLINNNWTITFNEINNKFTFSYIQSFTFLDSSIFSVIGFNNGSSYTSTNNIIISTYPCNFSYISNIYIESNLLKNLNYDSYYSGTSDIIACIPMNEPPNSIVFYTNITNFKNTCRVQGLQEITLLFLDTNRNFIDFNNQDWSLTLQIDTTIETILNKNDFNQLYEQFE